MTKFQIGDRVAVYDTDLVCIQHDPNDLMGREDIWETQATRSIGIIIGIHKDNILQIEFPPFKGLATYHEKQCRKLVKKK